MRPVLFSLVSVLLASAACGAGTPEATAQPKKPSTEEPLVHKSLESDADVAAAIREYYTKYEYLVPMRDGTKLFTSVFVPKDRSRTYPFLLLRTPYSVGPYGVDNYPSDKNGRALRRFAPSSLFWQDGYIIVRQDVRGRLMSEGTFVDVRPHAQKKGDVDESTDAYDTVDWLVKNVAPNNGRVGVWGISYPGFYAAQAAVDAHPAVKAVSPQAPVTEWYLGDDFHHNGVFFLAGAFDFYASFGKPRPEPTKKILWGYEHDVADVYDYFLAMGPLANVDKKHFKGGIAFWNDLAQHETRDDFWKARDPRPHYKNARPAVMTVGGWYDAEDLYGALETYRAFEAKSPGAENTLVMGPWGHGGWGRTDGDRLGDITFGQKTSSFYRDQIEFAFFQRHLKGKAGAPAPEAWIFETGTNVWQKYPSWPPPKAKRETIYLGARGALEVAGSKASDEPTFDAYVSDPQKPVPYRAKMSAEVDSEFMTDDQRFAARRPDVLVYSTGELASDVTLAGPIEADLYVSTTGTDADFVVKVIDVFPQDVADPDPNPRGVRMGGYQALVRGEIMRGKFRNGFERPEPFKPGEVSRVRFTLPDTCHTFRRGHMLMVQIQSSWFPIADRNPQTFVDVFKATEADFRTATHRIHRGKEARSAITVTLSQGTFGR